MSSQTVEERLTQAEKDIQGIAFTMKELLTWKRNMTAKTLPVTHNNPEAAPEGPQ